MKIRCLRADAATSFPSRKRAAVVRVAVDYFPRFFSLPSFFHARAERSGAPTCATERTNEWTNGRRSCWRISHFSPCSCRSFFRYEAKTEKGDTTSGRCRWGRGAGWRNDIFAGAKLRARDGMRMLLVRCASLMSAATAAPMQRAMQPV